MTSPRRIVIPGGSGYLGRHLAKRLVARGDDVVVLTRGAGGATGGVRHVTWDARTFGPWVAELEQADAIVHLVGKRVDVLPTRRNIERLRRSRVDAVEVVGEAVRSVVSPPPVWVQVATLAVFGDRGELVLDESVEPPTEGPPQMVGVARAWEQAYREATVTVPRAVLLRCGVAIGPGDPATARLAGLARLGLGGRIASGRQWVSWLALEDLLDQLERAIDDPGSSGTYHLTSPHPIRNGDMMAAYRRAVGRRVGLPAPAVVTRIGALALGSDPALALTGRRGVPARLLAEGATFRIPRFRDALRTALEDDTGPDTGPVTGSDSGPVIRPGSGPGS